MTYIHSIFAILPLLCLGTSKQASQKAVWCASCGVSTEGPGAVCLPGYPSSPPPLTALEPSSSPISTAAAGVLFTDGTPAELPLPYTFSLITQVLGFFLTFTPLKFNVERLNTSFQPEKTTVILFMSLSKCHPHARTTENSGRLVVNRTSFHSCVGREEAGKDFLSRSQVKHRLIQALWNWKVGQLEGGTFSGRIMQNCPLSLYNVILQ